MELLDSLKADKDSRKIFGSKELKIIEKQLMGIKLTQSEKNRLSRDIRKKLRFIKEINKFNKEFGLKKGKIVRNIIEDTINIIKEDHSFRKIKKILLFGSYATNEAIFRSDIDIAIEFDKIDLKEATKFRIRISKITSNKVDIQVYNILPKRLKESIIKHHKILYEKSK
ncbi:hypothetical protein CMI42_00105 [Candidatus Pacearchaeota archaeon]|jgi:hypothetical protein|nr:hypothetical protein [Candidatus Pacearchaeota archaeon]|tara:strand:+ start:476 stop:982 length:507 start_codon:yes stop_codon:yes gene_type:complete